MNQIANLIDHHYEQTGIHFSFASKQDQVAALDGDGPYAIRVDVERTTFLATGFSFNYRGATISGALPRVPAGYVIPECEEHADADLLPAVIAACGFPIDAAEVE